MNLLHYLAEANLYLGVFYLAYCLLLNKETHYQLNRAYLLFSCMAAFVLPVLQIGALKPIEAAVNISYAAPVYSEPQAVADANYVNITPVVVEQHLSLQDYLVYAYALGFCILFIVLMVKLYNLFRLMSKAQSVDQLKYKVVYLPESGVAFSFFNYLFIGNNAPGANTIIRHELVHIRQKHSFDIVFLELLKIINWFNPFVYLLQNSLKTVHEYIADEQTASHEADTLAYSTFLVNNAYGMGGSSITHSFFNYNLLKKRIIMLHQQRSGSLARLKYLVVAPICAGLLCSSTLAFSKTYGWIDLDPAKPNHLQYNIPLPDIAHLDKHNGVIVSVAKINSVIVFNDPTKNEAKPLLVANGKLYRLNKLKPGTSIIINADSTTQYNPDNEYALSTWGKDAVNGVLVLHGNNASVKFSNKKLPETAHINFLNTQGSKDKFPPPSVFRPGFGRLMGHLQHTVNYTTALREEKNSFVGVSFNVGADRKIADIKIFRPANNGYDDVAKAAFESFDGVVTAKPGAYTFMLNYFSQKGYGDEKVLDGNKYDVNLVIVPPKPGEVKLKFPPPAPPKSVSEVKTTAKLIVVDGKIYSPKPKETIAADGMLDVPANTEWAIKKWGDKAKNGVKIFSGHVIITKKQSTPPLSAGKDDGLVKPSADTVAKPDWEKFGKYFGWNVKYPRADRENLIAGRVITVFSVDADHNLQYAKVVRTPSESMGVEVLRVLKKCTEFASLKPGVQYSLPISFTLGFEDGSDYRPEIKTSPAATISNPDALIYNPNAVNISWDTHGLALNEVVIRGYVKK